MLLRAKTAYYSDQILECGRDQKALFTITNKLLNRNVTKLPSCETPEQLAETFADFFTKKILDIRTELASAFPVSPSENTTNHLLTEFFEFRTMTEEEIKKILTGCPSKSCALDPIPTWLVKLCAEELLPIITHVINLSLSQSLMPEEIKEALLNPLLKKASLDYEILKHFRPVSNLAFLSKLIEKVVAAQFKDHIKSNNLRDRLQSAYWECHSTETALLKVQNDILHAIDSESVVLLILLDQSAAFDTIDHTILLSRLEQRFGIKGKALKWFQSYLKDRKQYVNIDGARSSPRDLEFGVPQGSVLGPILFTCYTTPLGDIIERHGLLRHFYADDTQIYLSMKPGPETTDQAVIKIQNCIREVGQWMASNFLKLNDSKTEVMVFGAKHKLQPLQINIQIGDQPIRPSKTVRNLGVVYDAGVCMDKHISMVCRSANMHIRNIGGIRKYLTPEAAKTLVHSLVISRLDYANALLYGLPQMKINKLQLVQNKAARVITRTPRRDHITPVLCELHWLPVKYRIDYKVAVHTYRALNGQAPVYLQDLVTSYQPHRALRSGQQNLLSVVTPNSLYGSRSFSVATPNMWNSLPLSLRLAPSLSAFKKDLKTFLFKQAYQL